MALDPIDEKHALQIQAGTLGRKEGHAFEDRITAKINSYHYPCTVSSKPDRHVVIGDPAKLLLNYIAASIGIDHIDAASAIATGSLATSEEGKRLLNINGNDVTKCKSDLVITLRSSGNEKNTFGVSTKQCNNKIPTNAQLYFTTSRGFVALLAANGLDVTDDAVVSLKRFCGDTGFRPLDDAIAMENRLCDPRRFFWEEIGEAGRCEWERLFSERQDDISRLLFQKAYLDDPFVPEFVIHKTKRADGWCTTEVAIYSIDELIQLSRTYQGFVNKSYSVRKGTHKDPQGTSHLAPRFGIVQMQRGGQKQHPAQLQFNLETGYFYKLDKL